VKISIIGQGYVGQTLSIGAALVGHQVIGIDIDNSLIVNLVKGKSFVPGIEEKILLDLISQHKFLPTNSNAEMAGSEIVVIAVPTPVDNNRKPDLSAVIEASKSINKHLFNPALIISESTSYPGTLRNVIKPIVEENKGNIFQFAVAPERVDPGNSKWNIGNTTRVISGLDDLATRRAVEFYSGFCNSIYEASSPEVAEAAKLLENTFRQVNIALVNEVSEIVNKIGISGTEVINAAATKPFGFMKFYPSIGVGGHCIPVDPEYLSYFAHQQQVDSKLVDLANELNQGRVDQVISRIKKYLGKDLNGLRIQVAGIAYKAGVSDIRESPAIKLLEALENNHATVSWHDPLVQKIEDSSSANLSTEIDLGIIVTPHPEIDFSVWLNNRTRVLDLSVTEQEFGWPKFL
jgi:UDP-N-acetyl-D-glucosamine dehydrogenase